MIIKSKLPAYLPALLTLAFSSQSLFAGCSDTTCLYYTDKPIDYVASLSAGIMWAKNSSFQDLFLTTDIQKIYNADNTYRRFAAGELFLGVSRDFNRRDQGQLGLAIAGTSSIGYGGDVWDDADPDFNNFYYSYKVNHSRIALKGKLLTEIGYGLKPYVNGSAGIAFNFAHAYKYTPKIFEAVSPPVFKAHSTTSFTYAVGVGIQKILTPNWQIGIGYEFANYGRARLKEAPGQETSSTPNLSTIYAQGALISLNYNT